MDRCDICGTRIDTAVEEYTRLTSELICQHCMDDAVALSPTDAAVSHAEPGAMRSERSERATTKGQDPQ
jgi:recombinational DNA repair protein (RecF pathway)